MPPPSSRLHLLRARLPRRPLWEGPCSGFMIAYCYSEEFPSFPLHANLIYGYAQYGYETLLLVRHVWDGRGVFPGTWVISGKILIFAISIISWKENLRRNRCETDIETALSISYLHFLITFSFSSHSVSYFLVCLMLRGPSRNKWSAKWLALMK